MYSISGTVKRIDSSISLFCVYVYLYTYIWQKLWSPTVATVGWCYLSRWLWWSSCKVCIFVALHIGTGGGGGLVSTLPVLPFPQLKYTRKSESNLFICLLVFLWLLFSGLVYRICCFYVPQSLRHVSHIAIALFAETLHDITY